MPGTDPGFGEEIAAIDDVLVLLLDPQRVLGGVLRRPAAVKKRAAAKNPAEVKKRAAVNKR